MKEPTHLFNFQMPYKKYEELRSLSDRNDCSVAEIVRTGVDLVIENYKHVNDGGTGDARNENGNK